MRQNKFLIPAIIAFILGIGALTLIASTGTPSTLVVRTDANNYLLVTAVTQTNPVTQGVFSSRTLRTDSSGSLQVVLTGTVTPTYPMSIPASTCAAPSLGEAGAATTGIAFTATPSILNCISGTARTTLTASSFTLTVPILEADGSASAPSYSFTSQATTGFYFGGSGTVNFTSGGTAKLSFGDGIELRNDTSVAWSSTTSPSGAPDVYLFRDAPNILAQRNGTNAQAFRPYGYISGSRFGYGQLQTALCTATLSGATTTCTSTIPSGAFVIGVATTTTTAITGATGYTIGDGSDVDRWGDITGTALGTHSQNSDATANPTGWFAAANNVVLTAKTSNFTGGVVQVIVYYLSTTSA